MKRSIENTWRRDNNPSLPGLLFGPTQSPSWITLGIASSLAALAPRNDRFLVPLLLALLFLLSGCDMPPLPVAGTSTPEITPSVVPALTRTPEPESPVLTLWEPFPLDQPLGLLLAEMVHDFEVENPDVDVELDARAGYAGIHDAMQAGIDGGDLPDLGVAFPSMIAQYADAGVVVPLDLYLNDPDLGLTATELVDFFPGFVDAGRLPTYGNRLFAFPFSQNAIGMWVNQTVLSAAGWERPPATWDEFEQACFDVVSTTGVPCYPYVESASTFDAWLYSRGGSVVDATGRQAVFHGEAGVASLAFLQHLIDVGLAWRPEDAFGDYVAFAQGQAAFTFSSTGNTPYYLDAYEGALQWGVAPFEWYQTTIPQADPAQSATLSYGASFFIVRGDGEKERQAWRLIRWFTEPRQSARWAGTLQSMPVRLSALGYMTDTLEAHPFLASQVTDILPHARPEPSIPAGLEVNNLLYTAILSVTYGYDDPQTALYWAAVEANALLEAQP
ncbi:MAG: extracellular solute-binding protein [Anaerolineae bacterium]|nr:extracellular solute-binding protein [Anaerolineae bacterium]